MALDERCYLTTQGLQLIGQLIAGLGQLEITRVAVGDGEPPEDIPPEAWTELPAYKMDAQLATLTHSGNGEATVSAQLSSQSVEAGFFVRTVGIYARPLDGTSEELLYAVVLLTNPEWMRPEGGNVAKFLTLTVTFVVDRIEHVTAHISPDALARVSDLDGYAKIGHKHIVADIDGLDAHLISLTEDVALLKDLMSNDVQGGTPFEITFGDLEGIALDNGIWDRAAKRLYA